MDGQPTIEFFYSFDCTEGSLAGWLFPLSAFANEAEAIQTAASSKAILYKLRFVNGERTLKEKLFDPWGVADE